MITDESLKTLPMILLKVITVVFSALFITVTLITLLRLDDWKVRVFDFPRLQISVALVIMILLSSLLYDFQETWNFILMCLLIVSLFYQMTRIIKYTVLWKKQVKGSKGGDLENLVSVMVSNVYQPNRQSGKLIRYVNVVKPDLLLILESNQWWEDQLKVIEKDFPYSVKMPQDNLYGMHLYSRFEIQKATVRFIVEEEIPSIEAVVILRSGKTMRIYCLHPKPPSPTESGSSTNRDAELLIVGKSLDHSQQPILIMGDLNDVAWSRTTSMFQKISGLLDPRVGRGFYNTFHAKYPLMRWSLDHLFHSSDFKLVKIKRLGYIGSDHFPIYVQLQLDPLAKQTQEEPEADASEEEMARGKINDADPIQKTVKVV
jgi:endonuclease/exonuclease/phosphatase (EEP) superfamily protein YafD